MLIYILKTPIPSQHFEFQDRLKDYSTEAISLDIDNAGSAFTSAFRLSHSYTLTYAAGKYWTIQHLGKEPSPKILPDEAEKQLGYKPPDELNQHQIDLILEYDKWEKNNQYLASEAFDIREPLESVAATFGFLVGLFAVPETIVGGPLVRGAATLTGKGASWLGYTAQGFNKL